mgnify:CR=1 FL=1
MANKLQITLKRSLIGRTEIQKKTAEAIGLRKVNHSVIKEDSTALRGMLNRIDHLVDVKELD